MSKVNGALRRCLVKNFNAMEKCIEPDSTKEYVLITRQKSGIVTFLENKYKERAKNKKDFGCQMKVALRRFFDRYFDAMAKCIDPDFTGEYVLNTLPKSGIVTFFENKCKEKAKNKKDFECQTHLPFTTNTLTLS